MKFWVCLILFWPGLLGASEPELYLNSKVSISLISLGAIGVGSFTFLEDSLTPDHCRWCDTNSFDTSVRNQVRWSNKGRASSLSHLTGYALLPLLAFGSHAYLNFKDDRFKSFYIDSLVISEATILAALAGHIIRFSVARERPAAHFSSVRESKSSNNTSFYSGHTTVRAIQPSHLLWQPQAPQLLF